MWTLKLAQLAFILILVPCSKGKPWTIKVETRFNATRGSNLTVPCTFTYPPDQRVREVFWKTYEKGVCSTDDRDKNAFIFHSNRACVLPKYKKTNLIGNKAQGNCSLFIVNIQESKTIYMRLFTSKNNFSFVKDKVVISVKEAGNTQPLPLADSSTYATTTLEIPTSITISVPFPPGSAHMYLAIFIPLLALLIIIVLGIIVYTKRSRSHKLTRQESGYYVNYSRATTDPPKSEATCKTVDTKPPEKVIDEPIYANIQAPTNQMSQNRKHTENIYANMDN